MDARTIPPEVVKLAASVNMTPIDWVIKSDSIVIIFEQGPKMIFNREDQTPAAPTAAPAAQPADTGGHAPEPPKAKTKGKGKR